MIPKSKVIMLGGVNPFGAPSGAVGGGSGDQPIALGDNSVITIGLSGSITGIITPTTVGALRYVIISGTATSLTHNGTSFILPGAANIQCFDGDAFLAYTPDGTNWRVIHYFRGNMLGGYAGSPQNSRSAAYTTVLGDAGKVILHPTADNNARTFTIDSNANVPYQIGTKLTIVNQINTVTIAITSDTMTLYPGGGTGSRTLAAQNVATALKVGATEWIISGSTGLT